MPPPAAAARPCPVARFDLASTGDGRSTALLFVNRAPYPVRVLHLDAAGLEVPVLSLRAGEHAEVDALTSYAWRVRTQGSALLLELGPPQVPDADEATGVTTIHILECVAGHQ